MRPLATVVGDTTQGFATERGARYHDVNYPRCSRRSHDMRCDVAEHRTCHDNLVEALGDLGLDRALVHDTLNLFMLTGLDAPSDDLFVEPTQTSEEDYFELRAEDDCYVVASACPGHSNSGNHPVLIEVSD